jgi:ATP-dependent Clp protease ATP-binding subunit ClpC
MKSFLKKRKKRWFFLIRATKRLCAVLKIAQQASCHHSKQGDESMYYLHALIEEGTGVGFHIIINYAKNPEILFSNVKTAIAKTSNGTQCDSLTDRCDIVQYTVEASRGLKDKHVGTEHLLLGLLRSDNCQAAKTLHEHGLSYDSAEKAISKVRIM